MYPEPKINEILPYFILYLWFTGLSTTAHAALYFMQGVTLWGIHFGHYFCIFLTLLISCLFRKTKLGLIPLVDLLPICVSQLVCSVATCLAHDSGSNGVLYTQALTGIIATFTAISLAKYFLPQSWTIIAEHKFYVIGFALVAGFGWLEHYVYFEWSFLILMPLLHVAYAVHILVVAQRFKKLDIPFNTYLLNISGLMTLLLLPTALYFTADRVQKEWQQLSSVWEMSDYGVVFMSWLGFSLMMYTKYWLISNCTLETYLMVWNTKYHIANYGQLFLQNFTWNPLSAIARFAGTAILVVYLKKRKAVHDKQATVGPV